MIFLIYFIHSEKIYIFHDQTVTNLSSLDPFDFINISLSRLFQSVMTKKNKFKDWSFPLIARLFFFIR